MVQTMSQAHRLIDFTLEKSMSGIDSRLIACRTCGAIMMKLSRDICQKCYQAEEEDFIKVRDFIRDHPGASMKEVARELKIAESLIEKFVASGRLERLGFIVEHTCQTCRKQISTGIICDECKKNLKMHLQQLRDEVNKEHIVVKPKKDDDSDGGFHSSKRQKE